MCPYSDDSLKKEDFPLRHLLILVSNRNGWDWVLPTLWNVYPTPRSQKPPFFWRQSLPGTFWSSQLASLIPAPPGSSWNVGKVLFCYFFRAPNMVYNRKLWLPLRCLSTGMLGQISTRFPGLGFLRRRAGGPFHGDWPEGLLLSTLPRAPMTLKMGQSPLILHRCIPALTVQQVSVLVSWAHWSMETGLLVPALLLTVLFGPVIRRRWVPVFSTYSFLFGGLSTRGSFSSPYWSFPLLGQGSSVSHLLSGWWTRWCSFSSFFEF